MDLYLIEPSLEHKEEIMKMCEDFASDNKEDNFEGTSNLEMVLTEGFEKWLEKAQELGLDKALITCRENNIGSKKTIEKCVYQVDNSVKSISSDLLEFRYWVDISKTINDKQN